MYSVLAYGNMFADKIRMEAYVQALRQSVKEGSVVVDIGTGTGIFSLLACQFGAHCVYAIEPSDAIQIGREIAAANGYSNRIKFIQGLSTEIELPEQADVVVSDLRGVLPFLGRHINSVNDARKRFLAPGGVQIPQQDTLWAAVVNAPELYKNYTSPWDDHNYGFNMQAARKLVLNTWGKGRVEPKQLLTEPQQWAKLDYTTIENSNVNGKMRWVAEQNGHAHGLLVWFDTVLIPGIGFSNAPGGGATVYGSSFFPFLEPVDLQAGDQIIVQIKADLVADDYLWSWQTQVLENDRPHIIKADFKQSTFLGAPITLSQLKKQADNFVPRLNEAGHIDQFIISQMNTNLTQGQIAEQLIERYPHKFNNKVAALTRVAALSVKYCD